MLVSRQVWTTFAIVVAGLLGWIWWANTSWVDRIGIAGSAASFAGIIYIIYDLFLTKEIAIQTREAVQAALDLVRRNEYQYHLNQCKRLLAEIHANQAGRNWKMAALRLHDLAEHAAELACIRPIVDQQWNAYSYVLREWSNRFAAATGGSFQFDADMYAALHHDITNKVNRELAPLVPRLQGDENE